MSLVVTALLAVLIAGSQWVSNPEDLGKRFARAQGLLATADWAGAQHSYEPLLAVPDHPLLRLSRVRAQVGLREAARYQLANLARKQAQQERQEAALAAPAEAESLEQQARAHLSQAAQRLVALRDEPGFALQEQAGYLAMECWFDGKEYREAARAGQAFVARFPQSRYAAPARYDLGWVDFYLEEYPAAEAAFRAYVQESPAGLRTERARLQLGIETPCQRQRLHRTRPAWERAPS